MIIYKHKGISNGSIQFEWFSNNIDPVVTNPYPNGYEGLIFQTELASEHEQAEYSQQVIREAHRYLKSTDWMIIRAMDSGVPVPEEVKLKRQQARELL